MMRPRSAGVLAALACASGLGCGSGAAPSSPASSCAASADAAPVAYAGLWAASDYSSSRVGAMALSGAITSTGGVDLGADPALAESRGAAFFIARDNDLVFPLDPACGTPKPPFSVHQASHVGPSNPQDLAVASDGTLWVPLYDVPTLLVLHPDGSLLTSIDLSAYDGDGNPQASRIAIVDTPAGEKAFVTLERLNDNDGLQAEQPSWMLRVDVPTRSVEAHIELAGRNPFGMFVDGSTLWLSDPGNFDDATEPSAGIERFDTTTSATSLVVHEADLGGSVAEVAVSGGCGVAIVADATPANATSLAVFDAASAAVLAPASRSPLATSGFDLQGLVWKGSAILAGDRVRAAAGYPVHIFDATGTCGLTERPDALSLPLPPVALR
jgi:hypothetical protein